MRKLGNDFATVTPCRRTSSGRSCSALCTRFCTLITEMSAFVPTANVSAMSSEPVEELPERM